MSLIWSIVFTALAAIIFNPILRIPKLKMKAWKQAAKLQCSIHDCSHKQHTFANKYQKVTHDIPIGNNFSS